MTRVRQTPIRELVAPVQSWNERTTPKVTYIDIAAIDRTWKTITGGRTITADDAPSRAQQIVLAGDVLVSTVRPNLNAVASVPPEYDQAVASSGFTVLRPQPERLDSRYLFHWVRTSTFICEMTRLANGASYPAVSDDIVKDSLIPEPTVHEQRRVARILDIADDILHKRALAVSELAALLDSYFLEHIGDPIHNRLAWPTVPLQSLIDPARPITYGILKPGADTPGGIPYIRVVDMRPEGIVATSVRRTTRAIADEYRRSTVMPGDVLMSIRGHVGRLAIIPTELDGANITQDSCRFALREPNDAHFLIACLQSAPFQHFMRKFVKGGAVKGINLGDVKNLPIPYPPAKIRKRLASIWDTSAAARSLARQQQKSAEDLRQALQASAFRGAL